MNEERMETLSLSLQILLRHREIEITCCFFIIINLIIMC